MNKFAIMNILEIGDASGYRYSTQIGYMSNNYFLDADLLVIDLDNVYYELYKEFVNVNLGEKILRVEKYQKFLEYVEKRKIELAKYLGDGGNLLIFRGEDMIRTFKVVDDQREFKETFDLMNILDLDSTKFQTKTLSGTNVTQDQEHFVDFFSYFKCDYKFIYTSFAGYPIVTITRTGEPVALCIPKGKGNIIILPDIELFYLEDDNDYDRNERILQAFEDLDEALKKLPPIVTPSNVPEWTNSYMLGDEKQELAKLRDLEEQALEIEKQINEQKGALSIYQGLKSLLFESGKNLEFMVEEVFKAFGYEILPTQQNRDDLIIKHNDQVAVIEIKGVNGSSAEKQAVQLQKWVTEYHLEHDFQPKGILIVNTFREKPLSDRKGDDFPNQMMKYCNNQGLCLMTSAQLLELFLGFYADELAFEKIHNLLFNTIGKLQVPSSYIEKVENEES